MDKQPTALVLGIGGQDAAYLSRLLLAKGYRVIGTSRDATLVNRAGLNALGIEAQIQIVSMAPTDFRSVLQTIRRQQPDEIYHLAGQTSSACRSSSRSRRSKASRSAP